MQASLHHVMSSNPPSFPDRPRSTTSLPPSSCKSDAAAALMSSITLQNAVVVISTKDCCMSHVVTRLLSSLGVNPHVVELDMDTHLVDDCNSPAVFIGGRLLGGVDRLLAAHISGNLVPQLKAAGALWL